MLLFGSSFHFFTGLSLLSAVILVSPVLSPEVSRKKIVAYWQAQQLFMDNFVKLAKANETDKINFMQVARDRRIASIVMNSMSVAGVFNGKYEKYRNILRSKSFSQTVLFSTLFQV